MKYFINILVLFLVFTVSFPPQAEASKSCCSTESSCHQGEGEDDHQEKPCGSNSCDCICCGSISFILSKKQTTPIEAELEIFTKDFLYQSLEGAVFNSIIWQPPKV